MLESALESANYSSESADSNAYSPKVGVWDGPLLWPIERGIMYRKTSNLSRTPTFALKAIFQQSRTPENL